MTLLIPARPALWANTLRPASAFRMVWCRQDDSLRCPVRETAVISNQIYHFFPISIRFVVFDKASGEVPGNSFGK